MSIWPTRMSEVKKRFDYDIGQPDILLRHLFPEKHVLVDVVQVATMDGASP